MRSSSNASSDPENPILAAWREVAQRRANDAAVLADDGRALQTFGEIDERSHWAAEGLSPFEPGQVVGVQIGNHPDWPMLFLGLLRAGMIPLPLGRHMEEHELEAALQTCGASVVFQVDGPQIVMRIREGAAPPRWQGPAPHLLKLTSGTTSAPRAVRFRAPQLVADCRNICSTMGITAGDLNYGVIPISHSYGFSNLLLPLICEGVPMVVSDDRMPRAILNGLAASGATVFPGMPVFYDKLAGLDPRPELPRLRLCISAGAPLTPALAQRFTALFGLKIHTFYGSSECGGIGYDRSPNATYEEGCVGSPMDNVEIASQPDGRIEIRGAAVADGYFPEEEPAVLGDGRFIPGDLIEWRAGLMFLAGRASDLINIAGRKLNPAELETQLAACPGVKQAVVFGVPSKLRGEEPVACVAGESLTREVLARFCEERVSQWQRPRDFWIVPEIEVNERGKISRRALAERYRAERG